MRKLASSPIFKVSSLTAVSTSVKIATSFILSKILAITIGPSGIAMMGQITNGSNMFMNIATGGINQGITKYIAETTEGTERKAIINTAYSVVLLLSGIVAAVLIFFAGFWSRFFFHSTAYKDVIYYMGAFAFLYAYNTIVIAIINGLKKFKLFVFVNIANSLTGLIVTLVLLYAFGLRGALIASVIYQSVVFGVTLLLIRKQDVTIFSFSSFRLDTAWIKKLMGFSLMTLVSIICLSLSQLIIRSYITKHMSIDAAGIWEGINRLSATCLLFATASISTYYLPRLSEINNNRDTWKEVLHSCKVILPIVAIGCLFVFILKKWIILLLFNASFIKMQDLFLWQLIGDFFKVTSWMFAFVMWAKRWVTIFIVTEIIFAASYVALTILMLQNGSQTLVTTSLAYCINYFIYFSVIFLIVKQKLHAGTANR